MLKRYKKKISIQLSSEIKKIININKKPYYGIAFDIGTTSVIGVLINLESGQVLMTHSKLNKQIKYGTDILSRITYQINTDNKSTLYREIIDTINKIIKFLCDHNKCDSNQIISLSFSGNAVMNHILCKLSLENFTKPPYSPLKKHFKIIQNKDIISNKEALIYILPNIDGFIGGDIIGGIDTIGFNNNKIELFIDIGTNGEIVLNNKGDIICTSTAAGPAFEGVNIKYGMIAIDGAIYSAYLDKNKKSFNFKIINNTEPKGICGTGLIDIIACLINNDVIDSNGVINNNKDLTKKIDDQLIIPLIQDIHLTQKDIREFQLAKGAIKTGISILLEENSLKEEYIDHVYIAGAFGNYLNIKNALSINFLPHINEKKYIFIGNGSLQGAISALLNIKIQNKMDLMVQNIKYIDLAKKENFQDIFIKSLNF